MVEVITLSDDEGETNRTSKRTQICAGSPSNPKGRQPTVQDRKRPHKLVLVDSRQCSRMPRPRYLPIAIPNEPLCPVLRNAYGQPSSALERKEQNKISSSVELARSGDEIDDDEEDDPDYEDLRPLKRRKHGVKKSPKKHGRLTNPDWEIVRNGEGRIGPTTKNPIFPGRGFSEPKDARDYVKKLTANVDWENILRHLETLRMSAVKSDSGIIDVKKGPAIPRRVQSPANRLKQYWQGVLTKSVLKMDADCSK